MEKGQVVKVSKDADGIVNREVLTKNWTDWIVYWSVDFDFESKHEIIRVQDSDTGENGMNSGQGTTSLKMSGRVFAPRKTVHWN